MISWTTFLPAKSHVQLLCYRCSALALPLRLPPPSSFATAHCPLQATASPRASSLTASIPVFSTSTTDILRFHTHIICSSLQNHTRKSPLPPSSHINLVHRLHFRQRAKRSGPGLGAQQYLGGCVHTLLYEILSEWMP